MKKIISTNNAPAAIGPYSQAIMAGDTVYVSGQLPIDPATGAFPEGGAREQFVQIFKNLQAILAEAGCSFDNVVKTTMYLANIADFATLNEVYAQYFKEPYPARVAFQAAALPKAAICEIDVIAVK